MPSLAVPEPPEQIYSYRAQEDDPVPIFRPICQGDVFSAVDVPPFEPSDYAIVLSHPCSMRKGAVLREHVLIATVRAAEDSPRRLYGGNRFMPLPGLPGGDFAAPFEEMLSVETNTLKLVNRMACLDDYGIAILQQRQIFYMTRFIVEVEVLHDANAPILLEMELLEAWREHGFDGKTDDECSALEEQVNSAFDIAFQPYREQAKEASRRSRIRKDLLAMLEGAV